MTRMGEGVGFSHASISMWRQWIKKLNTLIKQIVGIELLCFPSYQYNKQTNASVNTLSLIKIF